jgi:uncharacterized protein (DUF1330 family)
MQQEEEDMAAYVIGRLEVRDTAWRADYTQKTGELIRKYGGRSLARFGSTVEALEGEGTLPTTIVILEFPSVAQAKAWYNDPEYAPMITLRQTGSDGDIVVVDAG